MWQKDVQNYKNWEVSIMTRTKKEKPEASDADDSFDYDQGYNIEEVYDQ